MNLLPKNTGRFILLLILVNSSTRLYSQPYLDIFQSKYVYSLDAGIQNPTDQPNKYNFKNIQLNLPYVFKKDSSMLIFNPILENWHLTIYAQPGIPKNIHSLSLPLYFIKPISKKWSITITPTIRWNGYGSSIIKKEFVQIGGFSFLSYKKRPNLYYRIGLYYNSEFSGPFFMPLAGIDWQINKKNNLFGVLPGSMTYEHKASSWLFYGATFRAITNSYVMGPQSSNNKNKPFIRIDENQLGLFASAYLKKHVVFSIESGHSILRKIRSGETHSDIQYNSKEKVQDNFYGSATIAYRLRFR